MAVPNGFIARQTRPDDGFGGIFLFYFSFGKVFFFNVIVVEIIGGVSAVDGTKNSTTNDSILDKSTTSNNDNDINVT